MRRGDMQLTSRVLEARSTGQAHRERMSKTDRSREPRPPRLAIPREQAAERLDRFLAEANAARETIAPAIRDLADLEEMGGGEWLYNARRHDLFRGEVSDKMKPIAELWARMPAAYDAHAQADRAFQDLRTSVNEFLLVAFEDDDVAGRFMRATGWYIGGQQLTLDQARQTGEPGDRRGKPAASRTRLHRVLRAGDGRPSRGLHHPRYAHDCDECARRAACDLGSSWLADARDRCSPPTTGSYELGLDP